MALINQEIKNLVAGISQQPQILRYPEQLEEQINAFSTEAGGLQKRPPTIHINKLMQATEQKPLVHFIDRDEKEQYIVLFLENDIKVFDLSGTPKTVNFIGESRNYIKDVKPRESLRCISIADYTFVANTTKKVIMSGTKNTDIWRTQGVLVNVKSGQYGRSYQIKINDTLISAYGTPDGSDASHVYTISTDNIANNLAASARTNGFTVVTGPSWLYITKADFKINSVDVTDGFNNQAMFGIHKVTQKFSNLPNSAPNGFLVKITGEQGSMSDDYYVQYDSTDRVWKECGAPGLIDNFELSTMPHALIREADGTFSFKQLDWEPRKSGDEDSNPLPTFVNQTINDIFFYRNRLGIISGENIILSQSAGFFNFWMASAIEVQDTDPIDRAVSSDTVANLRHAVTFMEDLIVFSNEAQFAMKADGVLTPKNAIVPTLTNFACSTRAKPVGAGRNIYFTTERSQYTTINEYFTANDDTDSKDAQDVTAHVPSYIPNGVYKLISSTIENVILVLTEGAENRLYIYKYLFIQSAKQQSAWSHWEFSGRIIGAGFINSILYITIERDGHLYLEKMIFTYNTKDYQSEPYRVLLDRKREYKIQADKYNPIAETTTIDLATLYDINEFTDKTTYSIVSDDGQYYTFSDQHATLQGDWTNKTIIIGQNYLTKIALSQLMIKQKTDSGTEAITEGRLQLQKFSLNYSNSGYFVVKVHIPTKNNTYEYIRTGKEIGITPLNTFQLSSGKFKIPINETNDKANIIIETDAPNPVAFIGASWVGRFMQRSRRI